LVKNLKFDPKNSIFWPVNDQHQLLSAWALDQ